MLLALCSASRSSDLCKLCISHRVVVTHKVVSHPVSLVKQSRVGHLPTPIEFTEIENPLLCPVTCLRVYEAVIAENSRIKTNCLSASRSHTIQWFPLPLLVG